MDLARVEALLTDVATLAHALQGCTTPCTLDVATVRAVGQSLEELVLTCHALQTWGMSLVAEAARHTPPDLL